VGTAQLSNVDFKDRVIQIRARGTQDVVKADMRIAAT
jgi:hypothetical protein